jgi:hypothetical protein
MRFFVKDATLIGEQTKADELKDEVSRLHKRIKFLNKYREAKFYDAKEAKHDFIRYNGYKRRAEKRNEWEEEALTRLLERQETAKDEIKFFETTKNRAIRYFRDTMQGIESFNNLLKNEKEKND